MGETISLIGQRTVITPTKPMGRPWIPAAAVIGLEFADGSKVYAPYETIPLERQPDRIKSIPLNLGPLAVERLTEFYQARFVRGEDLKYDCAGFAAYMLGLEDEPVRGADIHHKYGTGAFVHMNSLEQGKGYAVHNAEYVSVHAMIGGARPGQSLSTLGRSEEGGGMIVYASNPHIMDLYNGAYVGPLIDLDTGEPFPAL
jgi:hypothetical protein